MIIYQVRNAAEKKGKEKDNTQPKARSQPKKRVWKIILNYYQYNWDSSDNYCDF